MTESEYIQQHETYLSSIVSRFIARYPEQRGKMRDDLMQEARIAMLIAYRKQENTAGLERRAYICIIDALHGCGSRLPDSHSTTEIQKERWAVFLLRQRCPCTVGEESAGG